MAGGRPEQDLDHLRVLTPVQADQMPISRADRLSATAVTVDRVTDSQ